MLFVTEFKFEVGEKEKQTISFRYSKWTGRVSIKSDGKEIYGTQIVSMWQMATFKPIDLTVGQDEKHSLRFDIHGTPAFFSKPTINVYIDGKLFKEF